MSQQDKSLIDRNVITLRRDSANDGVCVYFVTFDNDITLKETYEMGVLHTRGGSTKMTATDIIDVLKLDGDLNMKYRLIRTLGDCSESQIVEGDKEAEPDTLKIEGDGGDSDVAIESFWEALGAGIGGGLSYYLKGLWKTELDKALKNNDVVNVLKVASAVCKEQGMEGAQSIIEHLQFQKLDNQAFSSLITLVTTYATVMSRFKEKPKIAVEELEELSIRPEYQEVLKAYMANETDDYQHFIQDFIKVDDAMKLNRLEFFALACLIEDINFKSPDDNNYQENEECADEYLVSAMCTNHFDAFLSAMDSYGLKELTAHVACPSEGGVGLEEHAHVTDMIKEYRAAKDDKKKLAILKVILNFNDDVLKNKDLATSKIIAKLCIDSPYPEMVEKGKRLDAKIKSAATEEMLFGDDLPSVTSANKDSDIYKAAEKLVTKFKAAKYKDRADLDDDFKALEKLISDAEDEPVMGDLLVGAYSMLFGCDDGVKQGEPYLKHVAKKGNEAEQKLAKSILDAIDDCSLVEEVPMCSYMFDSYDKDLEKDMIEACKLVEDGKSDDEKGKIKFSMGKEASRKFKENDGLTPYDYYCMAWIFEHSDTDEASNDAIEAGIKCAKEAGYPLDQMQFELLKKQIS